MYVYAITQTCARVRMVLMMRRITVISFLLMMSYEPNLQSIGTNSFALGIEALPDTLVQKLGKQRVGLITNHTGKDQAGTPTFDVLKKRGITVVRIFTPEHGMHGTVAAGAQVHDTHNDVPIISLYGKGTAKELSAAMMRDIDVLIFDIQDVGMRHYTYISTLYKVIQAAALSDKPLIVLDRPNPLGRYMEGPLVDAGLHSFISIASIPVRHGMTMGELALYFNRYVLQQSAHLTVVPMLNYHACYEIAAPLLMRLSPNIPNKAACLGYSFLGLLGEVRPFGVGVGTQKAFQCITLPQSLGVASTTWLALSALLKKIGIVTSPYVYYAGNAKKKMQGLQVHINSMCGVSAFTAFMMIVQFFIKQGVDLSFSQDFDKAVGTLLVREFFEKKIARTALSHYLEQGLRTFYEQASTVFLYTPKPVVFTWQ
jgi:uncharacterized protein YbbC (DUF1343 family)